MYRLYNKNLKERVIGLRKEMTPWERHLWFCYLKTYKVKFYSQRIFGSYIVDFFCRRAMLAIELDGSGHFMDDQKEKDIVRTKYLEALGIKVIRFTNYEVDKNFQGVCQKIDEEVRKRLTPQSLRDSPPDVGHKKSVVS